MSGEKPRCHQPDGRVVAAVVWGAIVAVISMAVAISLSHPPALLDALYYSCVSSKVTKEAVAVL